MKEKFSKFINVLKKDGAIKTFKKTYKYCMANYINKINIIRKIEFFLKKDKILDSIQKSLNESDYDRIIIWRGSFGWNVPLYQRPQHIAKCLSDMNCLIFYEVTRMTDRTKFIEKNKNNLFLVNYEVQAFEKMLWEELKKTNKKKYLQLYSTCWDVSDTTLKKYANNGFKLLYEYIDDLNPVLAGTKELPENVKEIHEYVCENVEDALVITSADRLYEDIINKRKSKKNVILSTNGVEYEHFANTSGIIPNNKQFHQIINQEKPIIGYYGALASWFDYDLLKYLADSCKNINVVLLGIKYDDSFDQSNIDKYENIYYLGSIDYKELPNYAQYFTVCTIPFKINEITLATNPIKVFEYMAMGKPIVTTELPECKKYKSVFVATGKDDFVELVKNAIKLNRKDDKVYFETLKEEALKNTWVGKAKEILNLLVDAENNNYKK